MTASPPKLLAIGGASVDRRGRSNGPFVAGVSNPGSIREEIGGALDRVIKASVHLADAADYHEFKLVWREHFPKNPPARTTVEVGDTLPLSGARISIDAIVLAGDSKLKPVALFDPQGSDPMEAEWAPHAVRAGSFVFCSALTASDLETGLAVGRPPGFPNYGSNAAMQANFVFKRLNRVLAGADTSLQNALEAYLYEPDLQTFNDIDTVWREFMQPPPCRSSMGMAGLLVPGDDQGKRARLSRRFLRPVHLSGRAGRQAGRQCGCACLGACCRPVCQA